MRSLLFVPGNSVRMLEKACTLNPDVLIPDLEDSISLSQKSQARDILSSNLNKLIESGRPVIPRINSVKSELIQDDLKVVIKPGITTISVGKIGSVSDVKMVESFLEKQENKEGLNVGDIKLILWIESALAIVNVYDILTSSPRIIAAAFGSEDFSLDMGLPGIPDISNPEHLSYPRSVVPIAARAAGILALDAPFFVYQDTKQLIAESQFARRLGYIGKFAIHPNQIDPINSCFSPTQLELDQARRIIEAYNNAEVVGRGSTSLDGLMIDTPVVERALQVLEYEKKLNID